MTRTQITIGAALVLLLLVVLARTDPDELRQGINRYSALALGAIVALVILSIRMKPPRS